MKRIRKAVLAATKHAKVRWLRVTAVVLAMLAMLIGSVNVAAGATRPKKSPVSLGAVGTFSGPLGYTNNQYLTGLRVWIKWINHHGGLNGHPVNPLIVADDGGDPARYKQLVQQLVEQDNVLALVFDSSLDGSGAVSFVTQHKVPFIGGNGAGNYFYQSPVYFPQMMQGTAVDEVILGGLETAGHEGKKKLGVIACSESSECTTIATIAKNGAPKYGVRVVDSIQASLGQPDYSAQCLALKQAGAQTVLLVMDPNSIERVAQSCSLQGYNPQYFTDAISASATMPSYKQLQGMIITSSTMPIISKSHVLNQFKAAMKKYAPKTTALDGDIETWSIGKMLELGAKHLPNGNISKMRKAVITTLGKLPHGTDLGFTEPFLFNRGKPAGANVCWFIERIAHHAYTSNGKRTCTKYDPKLAK